MARPKLLEPGGTAGLLVEHGILDLPPGRDAVLLSLENAMECAFGSTLCGVVLVSSFRGRTNIAIDYQAALV